MMVLRTEEAETCPPVIALGHSNFVHHDIVAIKDVAPEHRPASLLTEGTQLPISSDGHNGFLREREYAPAIVETHRHTGAAPQTGHRQLNGASRPNTSSSRGAAEYQSETAIPAASAVSWSPRHDA